MGVPPPPRGPVQQWEIDRLRREQRMAFNARHRGGKDLASLIILGVVLTVVALPFMIPLYRWLENL